jgi:hypothetical protein
MARWGLTRWFIGERSAVRVLPHVQTAGPYDAAEPDSILDALTMIDIRGDHLEAGAIFYGLRQVYEGKEYALWTRTDGKRRRNERI